MPRLRNVDYTDRELLGVIDATCGGDERGATTTDIALALGFSSNGKKAMTPARKIATRLSWMGTYGFIERLEPDYEVAASEPGARDSRWRLTDIGRALMKGKLSSGIQKSIERMDPGAQLLMMRTLTRRSYLDAPDAVAAAVKREYQHQTAQRKLVFRS